MIRQSRSASHPQEPSGRGDPQAMSLAELLAATVCVLVNLLDGFDVLIVSAAAGTIGKHLGLATTQLGLMFSVGLAGMMLGALLIAPLADRFGRRPVILACLLVNAIGMFSTGHAGNVTSLLLFRFVTGLGVGGLMPTINTAIAEVVHTRRRDLAVLIQCAAYPAGGLSASLLWSALSLHQPWQVIFQLSALPSLACIGLVLVWLPETEAFLKRGAAPSATKDARNPGDWILARRGKRNLLALTGATFLAQFAFYFFINWLPLIMTQSLAVNPWGQRAGPILLNLGGILGNFIFAGMSTKVPLRVLAPVTMLFAFVSICTLGAVPNGGLLTVSMAAVVGAALFAQMAGIYAFAPSVFPVNNRATGTGIAFSIGRLGGVLSPSLGAILLGLPNVGTQTTLVVMALPLVGAAMALRSLQAGSS